MVQWLRFHASAAGGMDFPDQGTKILRVMWHSHTKNVLGSGGGRGGGEEISCQSSRRKGGRMKI